MKSMITAMVLSAALIAGGCQFDNKTAETVKEETVAPAAPVVETAPVAAPSEVSK